MYATDVTLLAASQLFARLAEACYRTSAAADDIGFELREILARIADEREIRFFVDGTRNFGHQASTIALVKRLVQRADYRGHVRIVYADYGKQHLGRTADKLALLLPGIDPRHIDTARLSIGSGADIAFLPYERCGELSHQVAFGFTGGADDMAVNYAQALNVRYFCRVQPYLWDDGPDRKSDPYYESSRIECNDDRHLYLVDAWPEFASLVVKAPEDAPVTLAESRWKLYEDALRCDDRQGIRTRNAAALYRALQRRDDCRIWPAYGLHHFRETVPDVALNCLLRACRAQSDVSGPLIQVSFTPEEELQETYDLFAALAIDLERRDSEFGALLAAFRSRSKDTPPKLAAPAEAMKRNIDQLAIALAPWIDAGGGLTVLSGYCRVENRYLDISAAIQRAVEQAHNRHVVWVGLGTQPSEVLHHYFSRADLPGIIEGQAAASYFLSNGIPFLQILREEHSFKNAYPARLPEFDGTAVARKLNRLAVWLRDRRLDAADRSDVEADFSEVLGTPRAAQIDDYFRRVAEHCRQDSHDKFLMALIALRSVMQAREHSSELKAPATGDAKRT